MITTDGLDPRGYDNSLLNKQYNYLTIIDGTKWYDSSRIAYVKCRCICGKIAYHQLKGIKSGCITRCGMCYENKYQYVNNYVTILYIYDYFIDQWMPILINTNCTDDVSKYNWHIHHKHPGRGVYVESGSLRLHRYIVQCVHDKLKLEILSELQEVDHISGNTFNNLYYPGNDFLSLYYNNLRVCSRHQNSLNIKCPEYNYRPNIKPNRPYHSRIVINGVQYSRYFKNPEECIKYKLSILSPEDSKFYFNSPENPRNWNWTFNAYLESIGYNLNDYEFTDDDFIDI